MGLHAEEEEEAAAVGERVEPGPRTYLHLEAPDITYFCFLPAQARHLASLQDRTAALVKHSWNFICQRSCWGCSWQTGVVIRPAGPAIGGEKKPEKEMGWTDPTNEFGTGPARGTWAWMFPALGSSMQAESKDWWHLPPKSRLTVQMP